MPPARSKRARRNHLHPLLSYAFLLSAGTIAVSATSQFAANEDLTDVTAPVAQVAAAPAMRQEIPRGPLTEADLAALQNSAGSLRLAINDAKLKVDALSQAGRLPPQELVDAFGRADQIIGITLAAQSPSDLGDIDAGAIMLKTAEEINRFSKY